MERRRRIGSTVGVLVVMSLAAWSCGDDDSDSDAAGAATTTAAEQTGTTAPGADTTAAGAATTAAPADVDPDGVLRVAQSLLPTNLEFDITNASVNAQPMLDAVYDSLLNKTADGEYEPSLATEVTIVDPTTITVELRDGVEFSDGTPLDADAVKWNLERTAAAGNQRGLRSEILAALDQVEVTGSLSATVHLKTPSAGVFYDLFAHSETMLMSPTAVESGADINAAPVGAGPFVIESIEPEARVVMTKSPTYWNADAVQLAGIEFIHVQSPGPTTVSGLQAGQFDVAALTPDLASSVSDPIDAEVLPHPAMFLLNICKKDAPLSDPRVRQALSYAMDREVIAERVYGSESEPAWSLRRSGDSYNNPELDGVYARDVEKAKALLAEAGYPDGFSTEMVVAGVSSTLVGELLQAQWAEAGVDLKLQTSQDPLIDFYIENRFPMFPVGHTRAALDALTILFLPGAFANVCGYSNPELEAELAATMAVPPDSPEAAEGWQRLAEIVAEDLPIIPIVFHVEVVAHNSDRVGGLVWQQNALGNKMALLDEAYIKA